ncbi:CDP-alcohol phosphatidyltransferase-like enzyme [Actinoplanes italicus]|uniref:CDP-alcohol phosphatidyltransferase-like enzyme n=1 Tax=Actinoplanes italicus TaxID=113567 RepID=A0A2T0JM21_9ACTN|nr:CDP-alcohol phosphatidyltransferase-like enzyme [Actinoplanes italicus]
MREPRDLVKSRRRADPNLTRTAGEGDDRAVERTRSEDFRRAARPDAGLFTRRVNYPIAAHLGVLAHRLGLRPFALTLVNLVLGVAGSALVVAATPAAAAMAWLSWQAAYLADCADGQLARVTGVASEAGGRLDVLVDVAVQIGLVISVVILAGGAPAWLVALFAASWMISMVTSVLARDGANLSLLPSRAWPVQAVKMVRDHGFKVTVIAVAAAAGPGPMTWLIVGYTVLNCGFLFASIARSARPA